MINLSYFRFRIPYIEQAVKAERYQENENWKEIARLLEVRKGYEQELKEWEFNQRKGTLEHVHFYRFSIPTPAILAVKERMINRGFMKNVSQNLEEIAIKLEEIGRNATCVNYGESMISMRVRFFK
ncbi:MULTISPECIES: hypothetical protein [Enterococcus]|nr:hypothetical protein [Enterococcus avium]